MNLPDSSVDPVAPKVSTIFPNASLLNVTKIPTFISNPSKHKPYIQYLFQTNSQIACIKRFPQSEKFAISSSNAMYIMTNEMVNSTFFLRD